EHQRRAEVDVASDALAVEHTPRKVGAALRRAEVVREVLERAFAALVTDRAVEWMVDEQELEDSGASLHDLGRLRRDDHAVRADGRARRLQLRHLLDFHDADAAGAVDPDARVIAVIRNGNAAFDRG